jgi:hypothetical protein
MPENIEESPYKRSGDDQNHGQGKRGVSVLDVLRKAVGDFLFSFFGILALKMSKAERQPEDYHKNQGRQGIRNDMLKIKQIKLTHTISSSIVELVTFYEIIKVDRLLKVQKTARRQ